MRDRQTRVAGPFAFVQFSADPRRREKTRPDRSGRVGVFIRHINVAKPI